MAKAEEYAQWIIENADKKETKEFNIVAQAYQEAKGIVEPVDNIKADTGFTGAFSAGKERLKGDIALLAGKTGLMGLEDAERYKREKDALAQRMFKPTEEGFTEAPLLKFRELLGGSLPYMAAPLAAGVGAKVLGVGAGVGLAGAGLASLGQFTGSNLSRQIETGKSLEEASLGKATAAAAPQTALDLISLRMIPSIGKLFGAAGKEVTPELAKKIAEQGMLRTTAAYGAGSAKLAGIEGATEVGQQFLERLQAGLNISDQQARDEYFDSFIGGAVLGGTLAVPGTYLERGATVRQGKQMEEEQKQQAIIDRQKAQQEAQQKAALEQRQQIDETQRKLGVNTKTLALAAPDKKYVEPSEDDPLFNPLGRFQTTDLSDKEITEINQRRQAMGKPSIDKTFSIEDLADVFTLEESKIAEGVLGRLIASRTGFQAGDDISPTDLNLIIQERGISTNTQGFRDFLERTAGATTTKKEEDKIKTLDSEDILKNMSPPQRFAVAKYLRDMPTGVEPQVLQAGITTVKHYTPDQYTQTISGINKEFVKVGNKPNDRENVLKQIEQYSGLTRRKDQQRLLDQAILSGDLERVFEVRNVNGVDKPIELIQKPTPRRELPGGMDIRKETFKQGEKPDFYEIRYGNQTLNIQTETAEEAERELAIVQKNRQDEAVRLEKQIAKLQDGIQQREAALLKAKSLGEDTFLMSARHFGQDLEVNQQIAALRQAQQPFLQTGKIVPVGTRALTEDRFTYYEQGKPTVKFKEKEKADIYGISRLNDQTLQQIIDSAPFQMQTGTVKSYADLAQKELDSRTGKKPAGIEITTKQGLEGAEKRLEELGLVKAEAQKKLTDNIETLRKSLLPTLKRFGLEKVGLNIVESIENGKADGSYVKNLITLALDAKDVMGTLRHESIHALKELGGFTDAEWKVLTNRAKTEWVQRFIKDRKDAKGNNAGLFKQYQDQYKQDYGSLKGFDEYIQEEAIAEAFRFYSKNKLPAGMIGNIIVRLQKFFEALRNSLNKLGFTTATDIFNKIEEGGIKTLEPVKTGEGIKYDKTRRIDMDFKQVTERIPELQEGMAKLEAGEITAKQYDKLVNKYKTIISYDFVPKPATRAEAIGAIEDKETYGLPSKTLKNGHPVGLRLDIPAYSRYGVWVPTIHEQASGFGAGKKIGHESVAAVTDVTFGMSEKAAASIAGGKPKGTIATIKGSYKKISEKEAVARAEEALNDPTWTQVGMDPERHSYFYDRKTTEPVVSADEVIQIGPLVLAKNAVYAPKSQFKYALRAEGKPAKEVKARTMQDLNQAIPAKDRVVSKDPTKLIDGKSFLEADLDETGVGFLPFEEMGETETNRAIMEMWNQSIDESGGDYVREIVRDLKATPPTAAFLNDAFSLPNSARYWYELSAQKVNSLPIPSQFKDLLINLISATSGQTKPLDNMKRAISVLSEVIQGKPVETDLISAKTVENAIRNPDLETLKFGNFAGTMKFVAGMTNKAPTTTNDLQVADIFNMDANAFGKNPVLYEVVSRFYNKVRDLQNSFIPEQMQPYESWQIQALTWVENRGDQTSYQEKTNDDYAQAIDKITKQLQDANIPLVNEKIGLSTLKDPELTRTLRPTVSLFQESFKATVESNTLLNKEGKEANDEFELIKDLDLPWAKKLVTKFDRIQREAFEKIVSEKVINQLIKAIVGRAANVSRIDSSSSGTYEGKVSPNMRIPMFYKNSQNIPFKLEKSEINVLLAILGKELDQAAMAASLFTPVEGKGDTFRILIPNRTVSEEEISAFDRAVGYPINFFQAANGGVLEINVGGYDTKPTLGVVKNAIMNVFGDVKAKYIESSYDSTYITKDKVDYAQSYEEVINEFRESKFGGSDQAGLRTAFDRIIKQEASRLQSIASTRNKKFTEFTEESRKRRGKEDQQPVKDKYSLALGNIDPTTFLVSEKNPNNTGNLAFMPGAAPFAKYPIRLPVGTHDDISDQGYGANHILRRMQTDVKRRPAEVTKERLEDLILHIENLGKQFKRVYRSGTNLVLYDPLTDDAMFVKQLADHYEVQSMYSDARIPTKYGNAAWSGKNIQPPEAKKFEEKQRGILVQASREGRVEPKPVGVKVKRVITPNQIEAEANKEPTKGTLSLKKKMSLRAPDAWYYSQLERGIESTPDRIFGRAPQIKAWLTSNASKMGVKSEELQFSGINDFLELKGNEKVSKDEILNYLQQGGVRLEEVNKSEQLNETKYQAYQLDGGTNYQEMLITLPEKQISSNWKVVKNNPNKKEYFLYSSTLKDYALGEDNRTAKVWNSAEEAKDAIKDYAPTQDVDPNSPRYKSSHWSEENILAHIRMNDRKDRDGNKVLFIEELQSDWHQAGRKKGYNQNLTTEESKELQDLYKKEREEDGLNIDDFDRRVELKGKTSGGVPDAPFKDTKAWTGLALKRIIAYATENGYDKVAFINGEQSADRYNIRDKIDNIVYEKTDSNTYDVDALKDGRTIYAKDDISLDEVEETFGKEIAEKIKNGVDSSLTKKQAKEKIDEAISKWEAKAKRGELGVYEDGEIEKYVELMRDDPGAYSGTLRDIGLTREAIDKYQGRGYRNKKELSGLDLKVGGEGMINYYDNILPQVARDVLRKIGGGNLEKVIVPVRIMISGNKEFTYSVVSDLTNNNAYVRNNKTGERVTEPMTYDEAKDWLRANDPATSNPQTGFSITEKIREKVSTGIPLFSLRAPDSPEVDAFMNRIEGKSKIVNEDGTPKIMYHGTARDVTEFIPKQANAIFLTDNPRFAESFTDASEAYMVKELKDRLSSEELQKLAKEADKRAKKSGDLPEEEMARVLKEQLPSRANVIPVYVYSRNPFDYQKINDIEQVLNVATPKEMQNILQRASYDPDRLKRIIGEGSWNTIESSDFQSAIKRVGFDGFYVNEGGNKNLAVYDSSQIKSAFNVAPTKESKDIRFSFNVAPESHTKLEQVNTYGKTLTDTITSIFKMFKDPEERIKNRIAFIDPNSSLARSLQDQEIYKNGILRADLLARAKATLINLIRNGLQTGIPVVNSDGSLIIEIDEVNNLANSRIMADRLNDNYYVKGSELSGRAFVAEVARALRGKEIMEEDRIHNAKTGENRNREKQVTQKQIDWAEQQLKDVPEMQEIFDIWKKVNTGLINLWESVGLFSKAEADTYRAKKFYVSLAASNTDLETMMESQLGFTAAGLKSTPKVQKLEGAEYLRDKSGKVVLDENGDPVPLKRNIWENIDKQYASMMAGAYQNQVRKIAVQQLMDANAASIPTKKRNGIDVGNPNAEGINLRYKDPTNPLADDKGVVHAIVDNTTDLAAFESMHYELGPVLKFFGGATNILRAGALLNPMFWIRQLIRDPIHASIVANGGIVTPFHSAKEYINILRKNSEEAKILASRGVIGQYDSTLDLYTFLNQVGTEKVNQGNVQKAFHKLMQMHEASDAATRVAIFKKEKQSALEKGMTEEEAVNYAVMKAREAINFLVHGNSKTLNAARQMIPFLSASITSLDTVYRAATGYNLPASEKEAAKKLFKQRAALMFGASFAYAILMQDDEEYQKQPNYVKDNNWLIKNPIGDGFLKVAVPYEVGFLFKIVPEVAVRYAYGNDTGKEMIKAYKDGLLHNLPTGGVPVPQAIKPVLENIVNYSFFTGNSVESIGDARLPVEARGRNASETAKFLSGAGLGFVGLSPSKIDNLVQGYFAEAGTFMFTLADELVYALQGKEGTARNLEKQPFFKAFMTDPNADKAVANFYDIQQTANRTAEGFNDLKNSGRLEEAREIVADEEKKMLIASAPTLRKFSENMTKVRRQIEIVKNDQSRTPEERREMVNKLTAQYNIIAQQGVKAANTLGIR